MISHKRETDESKEAQDYTKGTKHCNRNSKHNRCEDYGKYSPKAVEACVLDNAQLCEHKATRETE